jgi:outer membrane beta-barrel protein
VRVFCIIFATFFITQALADERFSDYEIRVIRPRFFQKQKRIELGTQFNLVMNDQFVYTFLASGLATFHFTESWALEGSGAYGISFDKSDKKILIDDYRITTEVFRVQYWMEASVIYTPIYGKIQLSKGDMVYFDTFLLGGGGLTGVNWQYSDYCQLSEVAENQVPIPTDQTKSYPSMNYGLGQRVFRDQNTALRWDLRGRSVFYNSLDASCDQVNAQSESKTQHSITLQMGISRFF